jgi:hydrogenase maturation protease
LSNLYEGVEPVFSHLCNMTGSSKDPSPALILGLGNEILTDDSIGLRVLDTMQERFPGAFEFRKCNLGGLDILELINGHKRVVMIDAIKTRDGKAGSVSFLTAEDFRNTLHISNFHDIDILNAMEIGRKLGMQIPEKFDIIAIEIVEDTQFGEHLSPALEAAFPWICLAVEGWIRKNLY